MKEEGIINIKMINWEEYRHPVDINQFIYIF